MKKHEDDYISQLLASGQERREVEFKSPFSWSEPTSRWIKERTIRAALAMHNLPEGGTIVIGLEERAGQRPAITGMTADQISSFHDEEAIIDEICGYSTEPISLSCGTGQCVDEDGTRVTLIIVEVSGFTLLPAICRKNGSEKGSLVKGAIYTRAKKGRPSSEVISEHEMREIVRHAVSLEIGWLRSIGCLANGDRDAGEDMDDQQFEAQIRDAWGP